MRRMLAALLALGAVACASTPDAPAGPPSLVIATGQPAPPQARLYTDCITQAVQASTFDREANVLRFRCDGVVAERFYEGIVAYSERIGAVYESDGEVWRFTSPIAENPSFRDFCRLRRGMRYDCTVVLNIGEFLDER